MKHPRSALMLLIFGLVLAVAFVPAARAQGQKGSAPTSTFTTDLIDDLERTGKKLISLAEATPADKFSWRPNDQVRRVSEVYMHIVGTNTVLPSALGAAPATFVEIPEKPFELFGKLEADYTEKSAVVTKLKESFEYAAKAIKSIPASELDTEVDLFFKGSKRAYLLIVLTHAHEHLGQSIAYARSMGIVPPWSQKPPPAEGDEGGSK